jgi:Ca2+-dependent lipid-binding protein
MFEFKASIPTAKDLKVKVMDYDKGTFDETIGETVIDLEQRLLSRQHASCGLPKTYSV